MKTPRLICIILGLLFLLSSCGSAYIITDKDHDIYINGKMRGSEKVEITRSGFPTGTNVEIKKDNKVIASNRLKRKFTLNTIAYSIIFYIPGFLFSWQYPKSTYIKGENKSNESIWSKPPDEKSIWE